MTKTEEKYKKNVRNILREVFYDSIIDDANSRKVSNYHYGFQNGKREACEEIAKMLRINLFRDNFDVEDDE